MSDGNIQISKKMHIRRFEAHLREEFIDIDTWENKKASEKKIYVKAHPTTLTQNCLPSNSNINEAFSIGKRGGKEISAQANPKKIVGTR